MTVSGRKAIFDVSVKGEATGEEYVGKFVIKLFPSLKERADMAVKFSKFEPGVSVDKDLEFGLKEMVKLLLLAEDKPSWFSEEKLMTMEDVAPLAIVIEKYYECTKEYFSELEKK